MANKLLKHINNEIVKWENYYGFLYTELYDENDHLKPTDNKIMQEDMLKWKYAAMQVLLTLRKIKRNRFNDIKIPVKKEYKVNW